MSRALQACRGLGVGNDEGGDDGTVQGCWRARRRVRYDAGLIKARPNVTRPLALSTVTQPAASGAQIHNARPCAQCHFRVAGPSRAINLGQVVTSVDTACFLRLSNFPAEECQTSFRDTSPLLESIGSHDEKHSGRARWTQTNKKRLLLRPSRRGHTALGSHAPLQRNNRGSTR